MKIKRGLPKSPRKGEPGKRMHLIDSLFSNLKRFERRLYALPHPLEMEMENLSKSWNPSVLMDCRPADLLLGDVQDFRLSGSVKYPTAFNRALSCEVF